MFGILGGLGGVLGGVVGGTALAGALVVGGPMLMQPSGGNPQPAGDSIVQYSDS